MSGSNDANADDDIRKRLEARRDELQRLSEISAESRAAVTLDQQSVGRLSRMDALQQQAMAKATEQSRTAELSRIRAALARLEDGEYGYCLTCGDEIGEKRLAVDASVAVCINCAGR